MGKKSRRTRTGDNGVRECPTNYKRVKGEAYGNNILGWKNDIDALNWARDKFPDLPDHMIELSIDFCKKHKDLEKKWKNKPSINQKELSGKQRREMKKAGTLEKWNTRKKKYLDDFEPVINGAVKIYGPEEAPAKTLEWNNYIKGQEGDGRSEVKTSNDENFHQFTMNGRLYNSNMDTYKNALAKRDKMIADGLNPEDGRLKDSLVDGQKLDNKISNEII